MDWNVPFVIYRLTEDGRVQEVFQAQDLKMAKYWLQYIAQPWDVLCKTPLHPKHSKTASSPEYWSHKESSGTPAQNEDQWRQQATKRNFDGKFPDQQSDEGPACNT